MRHWLSVTIVLVWCAGAVIARSAGIWFGVGGAALLLGAAAIAVDRARLSALLQPSLQRIGIGAAAGAAMVLATYALYPLASAAAPSLMVDASRLYGEFRATSPFVRALALVAVITAEELVWRGVVQDDLTSYFGPRNAVLAGAALYALAHAPIGSPLLVLAAVGCGLMWGTLRAWTGSLVPALICHLIWDGVLLLLYPLA